MSPLSLHPTFIITVQGNLVPPDVLVELKREVPQIDRDYLELAGLASDVVLAVPCEAVVSKVSDRPILRDLTVMQLYPPQVCLDSVRELRKIVSQNDPGSRYRGAVVPIGDDGGDNVFLITVFDGMVGLYLVDAESVGATEPIWLAPSLKDFLVNATGLDNFLGYVYDAGLR
jgi:hypothetical protein